MNKAFFLVTDVDVVDGSHQLVHRLSDPNLNTTVYALVPDFQTLRNYRGEFPHTNFIYLDLNKSVNVNKEVLSCLPELDCILNYSGDTLSNSLHRVRGIHVSKTTCFDADEVSLTTIYEVLEAHKKKIGTVIINVRKKITLEILTKTILSNNNDRYDCSGAEALAKLVKKEKIRRSQENFEAKLYFRPGRKFVLPTSSRSPSPQPPLLFMERSSPSPPRPPSSSALLDPVRLMNMGPLFLQETQPLIPPKFPGKCTIFSSIFSSMFCCCCFKRCFPPKMDPVTPRFRYEQEIRAYTRGEQQLVLRRKLNRVLDNAEVEWYRVMSRVDSDEVLRIEELSVQHREKKRKAEEEERAKNPVAPRKKPDLQLTPRTSWTSGPICAYSPHKKKMVCNKRVTFVWDEDRDFHERADEIRREMKYEKQVKEAEHYSLWVHRQISTLRGTKDKYLAKYDKYYFQTFRKPPPFE
ncbi:uncharacterized protein LOC110860653 isoform X2 [Folsomia candida]|uniref:uncharacterized protein LOC110860653 isoform X2 n=1 Tax=Folsomia candida TaxID=158441 RepID=UPI0016054516|nr:uncharacterized protein LOC110860653 isoform X2 [Folsomia candida]